MCMEAGITCDASKKNMCFMLPQCTWRRTFIIKIESYVGGL